MAKITALEQARRDGMCYALKIAQERGIEGLEKEIRFRGYTEAPIGLDMKYLNEWLEGVKHSVVSTVRVISCLTLRDEFGFGHKRLIRYLDRFNLKAECLVDDLADWEDYLQALSDECGVDLDLYVNDQDTHIRSRVRAGV